MRRVCVALTLAVAIGASACASAPPKPVEPAVDLAERRHVRIQLNLTAKKLHATSHCGGLGFCQRNAQSQAQPALASATRPLGETADPARYWAELQVAQKLLRRAIHLSLDPELRIALE